MGTTVHSCSPVLPFLLVFPSIVPSFLPPLSPAVPPPLCAASSLCSFTYLFVCGHLCSSACMLVALSAHTLRCSSACSADRSASRAASDGKESGVQKTYAGNQKVSKQAGAGDGEARPRHSEECHYAIASLTRPDFVVSSLAFACVFWLERSRTRWDILEPSAYAFPMETPGAASRAHGLETFLSSDRGS